MQYIYMCVCECKNCISKPSTNQVPRKWTLLCLAFAKTLIAALRWIRLGLAVVDQWPTSLLVSSAGPTKWWTFKAFLWNPKQISSLWLVSDESRNFHMQMILRIKYTSIWTTEVLAWCSVPTFRQRPHQHPTFSRSPMRCDFDGATW